MMSFQNNKYFSSGEFDSPDDIGSGSKMDSDFVKQLTNARIISDIPYSINSGFRTKARNKKVGGKTDSSHLKGLACDIKAKNSRSRCLILKGLILAGFTRIGIHYKFIHVDADKTKPQNVFWLY